MGDAFDPNRFLDEGEAELQQQAPQAVASNFDANSFLDQGEQEFKRMSGAKQAALQPLVPQQAQMAPPMFTPPTAGPPMFQPTPKQTAPNQFDLGAVAGDFINSIPVVKEAKKSTPVNVAGNIVGGVPYGLAQVGDALKFLAPYVDPIGEMTKRGTGKMIEQATGLKQQEGPQSMAKEYQNFFQNMVNDAYLPEAFKTGGMLGQATLPAGIGAQANTLRGAVGLGALENALQSGVSSIGEQLADKGKVDALDTALSTALGGTIGGLFGGGGYGAKVAKGKINDVLGKFLNPKQAAAQQAAEMAIETPAGKVLIPQLQGTPPPPPQTPQFALPKDLPLDERIAPVKPEVSLPSPPVKQEPKQESQKFKYDANSPDLMVQLGLAPPKPKVVPPEMPPEGLIRQRQDSFGRNKVDKATDVNQFDQITRRAVQNVAEAKQLLDYRAAVLQDYSKKLWDNLVKAGHITEDATVAVGPNKVQLKREETIRPSPHDERELSKLREALSEGTTKPTNKQHVAAISGNQYGAENDFGLKLPDIKVPEDLERAFKGLARLKQAVEDTQKVYDATKKEHEPFFRRAQEELRKQNPQASFNARTEVTGPLKGNKADVAVSLDYNAMQQKLPKAAQEIYNAARDKAIQKQAADRNRIPKFKFDVKNHKKALAVLAAAGAVEGGSDQKAEAADIGGIGGAEPSNGFDFGAASRLALGLAALHLSGATPQGRKLLDRLINPKHVHASMIFTDTIQKMESLDKVLETNLAGEFWNALGGIHRTTFGVKMDEDIRAKAMDLLKQGNLEEFNNLPLTQEQHNALLIYKQVREHLVEKMEEQVAKLAEYTNAQMEAGNTDLRGLKAGEDALKEMKKALSANPKGTAEEVYNAALRNFMDFHFFFNPAFHLTNLSDMFISGMPRVGPMNLGRALRDLGPGGDKELKALFEHSNLTGGFKQEQAQAGARAKEGFTLKNLKIKDFESDKINADRVALGAMYQYRQTKGVINEYSGSDKQFVKDLIENRLDPSIAVDAWAHVAETMSRTLGVDPTRVNRDILSANLPALAVFIKQPARVSNLAMHYLANGEMNKLYWMLGAMAVAGGESAIPEDQKQIWERLDPDSYFMAAAALDKAEALQYITGKSLSNKTKWAIVSPIMSSGDPLRGMSGDVLSQTGKLFEEMSTGEGGNREKLVSRLAALLMPRVAGLPMKEILNTMKATDESMSDSKRISYYNMAQQVAPGEDVALSDMGISPAKNILDVYLPGEQKPVEDRKLAMEQQFYGEKKNSERQYFNPESKAIDPINLLFRQFGLLGSKQ